MTVLFDVDRPYKKWRYDSIKFIKKTKKHPRVYLVITIIEYVKVKIIVSSYDHIKMICWKKKIGMVNIFSVVCEGKTQKY